MKSELKIRAAMDIMGNYEVSWFGVIVETREKDTFKLIDIMFPPQINRPTFVETDDERYPKWYFDTFIKNNNPKLVRLHGHTHPNFGVSPSGTDVQQFKQIMEEVSDFYIQFIINNSMDVYCMYHDKKEDKQFEMEVEFTFSKTLNNVLNNVVKKETYKPISLPIEYLSGYYDEEGFFTEEDFSEDDDLDRLFLEEYLGGIDPYEPE